jgi:hypothetical protein
MFRFVTTRPPNKVMQHRIESRLIRDRRAFVPLRAALYGPGEFAAKLRIAEDFAVTADFVTADDPGVRALEPVVEHFRAELLPGRPLGEIITGFTEAFPDLARLLEAVPPQTLADAAAQSLARTWDSMYAQVIIGCDRFVSTTHLIEVLRAYQVVLLLWLSQQQKLETWTGGLFDDYEAIIDLQAAAAGDGRSADPAKPTTKSATKVAAKAGRVVVAVGAQAATLSSFGLPEPLTVGAIKPPVVGELLLVEEELRRYSLGELASLQTIMRGERREVSTRNLSRTSSTTTTETLSEQEETSSRTTDERYSFAAEAQKTAEQAFGVEVGVSVTGKFGPVQVGATANASFDTSQSSTESTSQEFAKTVTEEASKRVKTSIKETSSVTLLTETQSTTLQAFSNEDGTVHVNGLYRWIDKELDARLMNYGRRLMWAPVVPEPGGLYRGLAKQARRQLQADLVEPVHPSLLDKVSLEPLDPADASDGFRSFEDVDEANYAQLAAVYDVTSVSAPPPDELTGGKAIAVPAGMQPIEMEDDGLSLVMADAGLTIEAGYRLISLGVFAPAGANESHRQYADVLHMGEKKDVADRILVMVGNREFRFSATGSGNNDPKDIETNFNEMISIIEHDGTVFGDLVRPAVPITISASFSGMFALNVVYSAERTPEAFAQWQASTYAAVLKGYVTKKQAYDQAVLLVKAQVESDVQAQTFNLRADQYRAIELTELKRGCLELLTEGEATGRTSVSVADDGTPTMVFHEADATGLTDWRSPLANGTVAEWSETVFEWGQTVYEFLPYYWAGAERWAETAIASSSDAVFEGFLRAGSATVVVPVRPGYERPFLFFLKTGLLWGGRYLPLFTDPDVLAVYEDVEQATQIDPPVQVGETWIVRLPTSMVMLQEDDTLPEFPVEVPPKEPPAARVEPVPDESAPF